MCQTVIGEHRPWGIVGPELPDREIGCDELNFDDGAILQVFGILVVEKTLDAVRRWFRETLTDIDREADVANGFDASRS